MPKPTRRLIQNAKHRIPEKVVRQVTVRVDEAALLAAAQVVEVWVDVVARFEVADRPGAAFGQV